MHGACWITKATNIHSEYEILVTLPQQKWLQGGASILRKRKFLVFFEISVRYEVECDWDIALAVSTLA